MGTPTASQHNILDSEKLSQMFPLDVESDALPIEPPRHPMLMVMLALAVTSWL